MFLFSPPVLNLFLVELNSASCLSSYFNLFFFVSSAIVLFKQLKDKFKNDDLVMEALFDAVSSCSLV